LTRISGVLSEGSFPYASDLVEAPYTSGIIGGGLNANFMLASPTNNSRNINSDLLVNQGTMIDAGIEGSSLVYVNCNRVWYPIFAGDF
jgi:hypothetical protein